MTANKVMYGIKNVYYSKYTPAAGSTAASWGTPVALPGAVKLALTLTGSSTSFYADDSEYIKFETGSGYEGDLELAIIPDSAFTNLLGSFGTDSKGAIYEESSGTAKQFALLFEIEGDDHARRYAFYNCKASRPAISANTTSDSTTPDTQTLSMSIASMDMSSGTSPNVITKNIVKLSMERDSNNASDYDAWFTTVYTPTFVAG